MLAYGSTGEFVPLAHAQAQYPKAAFPDEPGDASLTFAFLPKKEFASWVKNLSKDELQTACKEYLSTQDDIVLLQGEATSLSKKAKQAPLNKYLQQELDETQKKIIERQDALKKATITNKEQFQIVKNIIANRNKPLI